MRKFAAVFLTAVLMIGSFGCGDKPSGDGGGNNPKPPDPSQAAQAQVNQALSKLSAEEFTYAQLYGTDSLGRETMPTVGFEQKYVGIFYCVWMGDSTHPAVYDCTKLLEEYGSDMGENPLFAMPTGTYASNYDEAVSPYTSFHYWGEPLYGYYKSSDRWVIRRHLELFMNAGIDFLFLDYSNSAKEYDTAVRALLEVILELQAEGFEHVPQITFMLPNDASQSLSKLESVYEKWYKKSQYDSCWFRGDGELNDSGKPMIIGRFSGVTDPELKRNLWLKEMQWPMNMADTDDAFPWMEWNDPGTTQYNHNGIMNVSVVQHVNSWSSTSYTDSLTGKKTYEYRARGWSPEEPDKYGTDPERVLAGSNFEWQWGNALAVKDELKMVSVTGWNEWIAQKITYGNRGYAIFNDCFNYEFSRDAEMMKGGYGDNYYMQIARNVRDFKGLRVSSSDNVALFGQTSADTISEISSLAAAFLDIGGDTVARTEKSVGQTYDYADRSNRNNIEKVRVGNDGEALYVAVTTEGPIEEYAGGDNWMTLYLDCGTGGWGDYNFVVNRSPDLANGETSVERFTGTGSATEEAGRAAISVEGNTVLYKIPLSLLGVKKETVIGIKATDNLQKFGDFDDFYISGDSAPLGRLSYAYKIA